VHRDGENTMDVSADLMELGRCPVAVVSAGVKSILDIPRTLEFLETQGVTVASYQSPGGDFPAFYTRTSGSKVPYNLASPEEAAALLASSEELDLKSGILIGVPVPERFAMDEAKINGAIDAALTAANDQGIAGKEVTPFVLAAVSKITEGQSLQTSE
jgi:pseudouridylate synthase / pseudouridine kinase